jgi:hypothetical protein
LSVSLDQLFVHGKSASATECLWRLNRALSRALFLHVIYLDLVSKAVKNSQQRTHHKKENYVA